VLSGWCATSAAINLLEVIMFNFLEVVIFNLLKVVIFLLNSGIFSGMKYPSGKNYPSDAGTK
jgi:hypothetical protein